MTRPQIDGLIEESQLERIIAAQSLKVEKAADGAVIVRGDDGR
jgi:hypothetical protein